MATGGWPGRFARFLRCGIVTSDREGVNRHASDCDRSTRPDGAGRLHGGRGAPGGGGDLVHPDLPYLTPSGSADLGTLVGAYSRFLAGDLIMVPRAVLRRFRPVGRGTALLLAWACMPASVRGQELTALASFNGTAAAFPGTTGANPVAGVTFDANGNLFGTALDGGDNGYGTVWELAKGSSTITPLASFGPNALITGASPWGGVTLDANGNLFGTAQSGGPSGNGTVWELAKGSSTITPLASFIGTTGTVPAAAVTFDASGNLFGTALYSGANNVGTVWELSSVPEPSSLVLGLISLALAGAAALLKPIVTYSKNRASGPF
jgi:uncharacterized repeat protein (TIGR03803 family)